MWEIRGRRFISVHIIGVGVGVGSVLVLSGRNECRCLDLVYQIKEELDKGLMVRASLDLLLLLVSVIQTQRSGLSSSWYRGRERERVFRFATRQGS